VAVPGLARRWDALSAACLMGTAAHGLELDYGYTPGSVHPWACCRHLHPALDGLFDIQRTTGLRAADVTRITNILKQTLVRSGR